MSLPTLSVGDHLERIDNFYYFFSYEDTRDAFDIPHDLRILDEVFRCKDGGLCGDQCVLAELPPHRADRAGLEGQRLDWSAKVDTLRAAYGGLSDRYQSDKGRQGIPLD